MRESLPGFHGESKKQEEDLKAEDTKTEIEQPAIPQENADNQAIDQVDQNQIKDKDQKKTDTVVTKKELETVSNVNEIHIEATSKPAPAQ